jgi:hypothetical protein
MISQSFEPEPATDEAQVHIRFLAAEESSVLVDLVREAYGDTYDAEWVYQADQIAHRINTHTLRSAIGHLSDGTILGHMALMVEETTERVMHAGIAVVRDAARGHHVFERLKRFAAQWATEAGYLGIFSEATAAHPYSQKANVALGAHETGFLLGWIPSTVSNNAVIEPDAHRQSVALFYLKLNGGDNRPMFVPERHQAIVASILETSGLHGEIVSASSEIQIVDKSVLTVEEKDDHNSTVIHVEIPGQDLARVVSQIRVDQLEAKGRDAVYLDMPLQVPQTQMVLEQQEADLQFSFAGIFPNRDRNGDALRLQSFGDVDLHIDDIVTASDHGQELLEYVLSDLRATQKDQRK